MDQSTDQTVPGRKICYEKSEDAFFFTFPYDENLVNAVRATFTGRQWDRTNRRWIIPAYPFNLDRIPAFSQQWGFELDTAAKLRFDTSDENQQTQEVELAERAKSLTINGLGGELRPYQKFAVVYALEKQRLFICDEMGIGKTVEALATLQAANAFPALVICPSVVKINWLREIDKWLPGKASIVLNGRKARSIDSVDVVIVNYDILTDWLEILLDIPFKSVVMDESHYIKDGTTKRAKSVRELVAGKKFRIALSGTPIVNRPAELISQLIALDLLKGFGGYLYFIKRYCAAKQEYGHWNISGASNLDELNNRLRAVGYIRRLKSNVLDDLPPLQRCIIPVGIQDARENYDRILSDSKAQLIQYKQDRDSKHEQKRASCIEPLHTQYGSNHILATLEKLKQEAVALKLPTVIQWVRDFMESDQKLVIFAIHRDVIDLLAQELGADWGTVTITGKTTSADRQKFIDQFQNDPTVRIMIANMRAGGVGVSFTASSHVAFVELDWTAAAHDQAESRCHRSGQTQGVNAYYFLAENTIDEYIFAIMERKRAIVDQATNGLNNDGVNTMLDEVVDRLIKENWSDQ